MRTEAMTPYYPCSLGVLAADTLSAMALANERPALSSLRSPTPQARRPAYRLTDRDRQIVELVCACGALRGDQIQTVLFTPGAASRCQRRLTLLRRYAYLDCLPRPSVNAPAIYVLSRRSLRGNRLVRARWGTDIVRPVRKLGSIEHLLAVNDVRVRIQRACRDLGWTLGTWQRPVELAPLLTAVGLIPDAYFQVQRPVDRQERTAGFFLEVERSVKTNGVVLSKLRRYAELYYSGAYQERFGTRALRVLVVFTDELGGSGVVRARAALKSVEQAGMTLARFASLNQLCTVGPEACLVGPVWHQPGFPDSRALFRPTSSEAAA